MKGRVIFRLEKGNPAKLADLLSRKDIVVYKIDAVNKTFEIDECNEKSAVAYMDELCYNYCIVERRGLKSAAKSLWLRKGLIIGTLLAFTLVVVLSNLLFSVQITGLELVKEKDVIKTLEELSVKKGIWTFGFDEKKVENALVSLDGVASASVNLRGNVLLVTIQEELPPPDITDLNEPVPILSNYDAIITRIVSRQGTKLKQIGDTVKKGDILIGAYTLVGDEENQEQIPLRAVGEVYGKTWLHERVVLPFKQVVRRRTGKSVRFRDIVFPGLCGMNNHTSPYQNYESVIERQTIGVLLPVEIVTQTFYEVSESIAEVGERDLEIAVSAAEFKIKSEMPEGAVYLNKWYINDKTENSYIVDIYYEIEIRLDGGK